MEWIFLLIWAVVAYFIAKRAKEKHEGININPWMYALGSFLFGFLITMPVLNFKIYAYRQDKTGVIVNIVLGIIGVILTIGLII